MYDSVRRSCAVSAVVWVVALGATACTGDSGDGATRDDGRARAASCTDGEYAWSGVRHRTKLTALGEPVTFAKGTDSYRTRLEPLDADTVHRPTVSGVPAGVAPARVIKALGAHLKVEEPRGSVRGGATRGVGLRLACRGTRRRVLPLEPDRVRRRRLQLHLRGRRAGAGPRAHLGDGRQGIPVLRHHAGRSGRAGRGRGAVSGRFAGGQGGLSRAGAPLSWE